MLRIQRPLSLALAGVAAVVYCTNAYCDGLVGGTVAYREITVFEQPALNSIGSNLLIGTHEPLSYYEVASGNRLSTLAKGKMYLMLWADDELFRLSPAASAQVISPWTGLQTDSPHQQYQSVVDAGRPGSSGFQVHGNEVGINIHADRDDPDFPINNIYNKATSVLQYTLQDDVYPFKHSYQDELELSFDLKVASSNIAETGNLNVIGYLLMAAPQDGAAPARNLCIGAMAFDPRLVNPQPVQDFPDPETGCLIINFPLGYTPGLNLSDSTTAKAGHLPSGYQTYKLTLNGMVFRDVLRRVTSSTAPISYDVSKYHLKELVFNPEGHLPGAGKAQVGLSIKNWKVVSRQTYPAMGYVDDIRQQGANWIVDGWACARAWNTPITVALFGGQSYERGGTLLTTVTANLPNLSSENQVCGTTPGTAHRFQATLPASAVSAAGAVPLYVHAVRGGSQDPSVLLAKSGQYQVGNGAVSALATKLVYRWALGNDRAYSTDPHEYDGTGYVLEGEATRFRIKSSASAGAVPLYRCVAIGRADHFLWTAADCNGQSQEGLLGYMEANAIQGMRALYQFYHPSRQVHLATTQLGESWVANNQPHYTLESQFGYVW